MATDRSDEGKLARWRKRAQAPENELPAGIEPFGVLGRSDAAVVTVTGVQVYSTGLSLDLTILVRQSPHGRSVFHRLTHLRQALDEPDDAADWLWLGVAYADERLGLNVDVPDWNEPDDDRIYFSGGRGSGAERVIQQNFWLSSLPPPGAVTFACTWLLFGIPETRTVVEAGPILQAATRVEVLWPPASDEEPQEPQRPTPVSDWFAQAMRDRNRNDPSL